MHLGVAYLVLCTFSLWCTKAQCSSGNHEGRGSRVDSKEKALQESRNNAYNLSVFINKVLNASDRKVRPNAGGKPVMVLIEFKVISFGEIKEANMEYSFDIFLRQWWNDPRFANNFTNPFTMAADPTTMFWTPDTYFWNVKKSSYHHVTRENMRVMIWPDGKIYFSSRITITAQCDMDLRLYPMDTQHCPLIIESYAYTTNDLNYTWKGGQSQGIEIVSKEMAQFDLIDVRTATKSQKNSKGSFASLTATFSFRRRTESFVSSVYVPAVVLVVLSWCCFFIQPEAVPARIGLSITTILTSILLQGSVNSNMPKVSYMKAVDYFLLTSFGFIFAALLEYILVLNSGPQFDSNNVCKRSTSEQMDLTIDSDCTPNVDIVVKVMDEGACRIRNKKGSYNVQKETPKIATARIKSVRKQHWIDRISRFIFPTFYVIFIICYTSYYLSKRKEE
ncbi:gamma-aminobutyric acid receptor subunit beta-2 isoform X2 [Exaiptasia diaphana]|nr:gamma-aminobutyric acid receptor subunit beta-2 isoform X2 [Exaiptasia diaphana]XP_020908066.1 gamma-aminobutyric acid receptor subunit beta-2 isoform X2 [Exaiptasia diaphana]XP_020908074.1 gamma-aminobutyric acid receptor subunit beta-2 isoform X2 [Exaiptasia diaphana]XP_020908083.1 gamma-aminobutyric acid receptor subunit beta-2 isoform X2 [Exaiptasia diaphana]XP_028517004.1 gamma-aminobutyric acid receptor subunit beta-2 isoform X2 [Exaiptasia diaphana]KXJ20097.1 Gamma-aminobutyric acid 